MYRSTMDRLSLILVVVGAVNWLLVGIFNFDVVSALFGSSTSLTSKIVYSVIGLAGIYSSSLLFRESSSARD